MTVLADPQIADPETIAEQQTIAAVSGTTVAPGPRLPRSEQLAQALVTAVLYAVPALICLHAANVSDPDIWWHLRSAEWIRAHHALPRTDPFSTFGAGKPWAAYSWLFELIVLQLFQAFGLLGIVLYTTGMVVATTAALHHMLRRLYSDFSVVVLLTFVASLCMGRLYTPRPWHFTILFFVLELDILMHARRSGRVRELVWLPLIFALWANTHIQFINGLIVLALFAAEPIAARWLSGARTRLTGTAARWAVAISPICLLATLINPYGWGIYKVAHDLAAQPGVIDRISELQAMPFRGLSDFCVLLLALAAAAALARNKRLEWFELLIFAFAILISFRSQRDAWAVAVIASAVIGRELGRSRAGRITDTNRRHPALRFFLVPAVTALIVFAGFRAMHVKNARLSGDLAAELPVHAADAIKAAAYSGPLFNDYAWGGYLMWALHRPVSIDGRAALHGTDRLVRFSSTWNAEPSWTSDTELAAAGVVVGPVKSPLIQVLRLNPRYRLAYEDKLSAVFVASRTVDSR